MCWVQASHRLTLGAFVLQVGFSGWARMAQTIDKFAITEVRKPKVGENKPAAVTGEGCLPHSVVLKQPSCMLTSTPWCAAEITINLANMRPEVRAEWDELKQHDVLFLLTIRPPDSITANYMAQSGQAAGKEGGLGVMERYGLQYVRGCEVIELRDEGEWPEVRTIVAPNHRFPNTCVARRKCAVL